MGYRSDEENQAFAAVDDALRGMPLEPAPPGLAASVLARIQGLPDVAQGEPVLSRKGRKGSRFRLTWLDAALSLFAAGMIALAWLLTATLPPVLIAQLRNQALYTLQTARLDPMPPLVLLGGAVLAGAGVGLVVSTLLVRKKG